MGIHIAHIKTVSLFPFLSLLVHVLKSSPFFSSDTNPPPFFQVIQMCLFLEASTDHKQMGSLYHLQMPHHQEKVWVPELGNASSSRTSSCPNSHNLPSFPPYSLFCFSESLNVVSTSVPEAPSSAHGKLLCNPQSPTHMLSSQGSKPSLTLQAELLLCTPTKA